MSSFTAFLDTLAQMIFKFDLGGTPCSSFSACT